jgi:hypothetical protein
MYDSICVILLKKYTDMNKNILEKNSQKKLNTSYICLEKLEE